MYALVRLSGVGFRRSMASRIFLLHIQNVTLRMIKKNRQLLEEKWTSIIEDDADKGQTEV